MATDIYSVEETLDIDYSMTKGYYWCWLSWW
jgi:hypothetical protein